MYLTSPDHWYIQKESSLKGNPQDAQYTSDGTLCFRPIKYIKIIVCAYESMLGKKTKISSSPLGKNDHPELDTSGEVDDIVIPSTN